MAASTTYTRLVTSVTNVMALQPDMVRLRVGVEGGDCGWFAGRVGGITEWERAGGFECR
jgi:hypothetical protein